MSRRLVVLGLLVAMGFPSGLRAQTHIVSLATGRKAANHDSYQPRVSADGRRIVFVSKASNLVAGDFNGKEDVFLWDGRADPPVIRLISMAPNGAPANGPSEWPSISPDGNYVAFNSSATNLGAPPTNGWSNVYVRNISGMTTLTWFTEWVSRAYDGKVPNGHCGRPSMSDVGLVAFECHSLANNMVPSDRNECGEVFVADVDGVAIERVSTTSGGVEARSFPYESCASQYPSISADGRLVVFESYARTLVPNDTNGFVDIFVKNLETRSLQRVMADVSDPRTGLQPNGTSLRPAISGDGRFVAYESQATNLANLLEPTTGGVYRVYRTDLATNDPQRTMMASRTGGGSAAPGIRASINHDGSVVAYEADNQVYLSTLTPLGFLWSGMPLVTQASRTPSGDNANGETYAQASLAPSATGPEFVVWSSSANTLNLTEPAALSGHLNVYARAIGRRAAAGWPMSIIALPPAAAGPVNTVVDVPGPKVGERRLETIEDWEHFFMNPTAPLREALTDQPTVTVGGVAATGVSTPDVNTLRFTAPALAAGSSNVAVIRYADGEVVTLPVALKAMALVPGSTTDTDKDTLPDWWELTYGLDPNLAADAGVVQANGLTPVQARAQQHHPTGTDTRYLAEGATGTLFRTRIALANPGVLPATALLRYAKANGTIQTQTVAVPAMRRATVDVETLSGMGTAEFATAVESDLPLIVDRTLTWGGTDAYGAHAETAVAAPALVWYLAEGATTGTLNLFYLLQNPNAAGGAGARALPAAERRPDREGLHAGAELAHEHLGRRRGVPGARRRARQHRRVGRLHRPQQPAHHRRARVVCRGAGPVLRRRPRERGRDGAGPGVVPRRRRDG